MRRKTRWYCTVLLTVLMFLSMLPMGALADSQQAETLPNTDPCISEPRINDEGADGEKGDSCLPPETPSDAEDEKEANETVPAPAENDNDNEEQTEVDGMAYEQTMAGDDAEPETEAEEQETEEADDVSAKIKENEVTDLESGLEEEDEGFAKQEIPNPTIRLKASFDGQTLTKGTLVTIKATIEGIPDGMSYNVQWRNDMSGEFRDVPGETGMSVKFLADEWNVNCTWQLALTLIT